MRSGGHSRVGVASGAGPATLVACRRLIRLLLLLLLALAAIPADASASTVSLTTERYDGGDQPSRPTAMVTWAAAPGETNRFNVMRRSRRVSRHQLP
jgi:hypothetical protein